MPDAERWLEWVEPFGPNSEPVYLRVTESTAIASAKSRWGSKFPYPNDEQALSDFMIVHGAYFREEKHEQ